MLNYENYIFVGFLPEIFLSTAILGQLLYNVLFIQRKNISFQYQANGSVFFFQTLFILISVLALLFFQIDNSSSVLSFSSLLLVTTKGTCSLKIFIMLVSVVLLPCIAVSLILQKINSFEYYTVFLVTLLSSLLLVSANDFLIIFLILEIQSFCFYGLTMFRKDSTFSIEAGLKYFIFGSIASGFLLFSLSCLYGITGTLNLFELTVLFHTGFPFVELTSSMNLICECAIFGIIIAILFKLGSAPLHFWVPDVYEGSPISSTIIFTVFPKIVLFELLIKIKLIVGYTVNLDALFFVFGLATIFIGSFLAVSQTRLKRFFICSSIAQMGFPIIIFSSESYGYFAYIYFFIFIYILSAIGMWLSYIFIYFILRYNNNSTSDPIYIDDLAFIKHANPRFGYFICFYSFILSGLPPFATFFSKYFIISVYAYDAKFFGTIAVLIASLISTFYYIRLIKVLFFDTNKIISKSNTTSLELNKLFLFINKNTENSYFLWLNNYILIVSTVILTFVYYFFDSLLSFSNFLLVYNFSALNLW